MTCLCPKCASHFEIDLSEITIEGFKTKCPDCNTQVQLVREPFARIAYRSSSNKTCISCGSPLSPDIACQNCGHIYPDFIVVVDPAEIRRRVREKKRRHLMGAIRGIEFRAPNFRSLRSIAGAKSKQSYHVKSTAEATQSATFSDKGKLRWLVISITVLLMVMGGGYIAYARHQAEQTYLNNYFKALYAIKTGVDLSESITGRMSSEWKTAMETRSAFNPQPSADEIKRLNSVKNEVDKMLGNQLAAPPKKLAASRDGLLKLNEHYTALHALACAPPASLEALMNASAKSSSQFNESVKAFKTTLPEDMRDDLEKARKKYKNLSAF